MFDLTPTQQQARAQHLAFRARIAARAVEQVPPRPAKPIGVKGDYRPPIPFKPTIIWPVLPEPAADPVIPVTLSRVAVIQNIVMKFYGVTRVDLLSARRTKNIAKPRQVAMYLARTLTAQSLPDIGRRFGRDHATVLHAVRKITKLAQRDMALLAELRILSATIAGAGA